MDFIAFRSNSRAVREKFNIHQPGFLAEILSMPVVFWMSKWGGKRGVAYSDMEMLVTFHDFLWSHLESNFHSIFCLLHEKITTSKFDQLICWWIHQKLPSRIIIKHSANTTKQMKRNQNTGASRSLANVADYTFFFFLKWIQNFEGMTEQHNIPKWHSYLNNAVVAGKWVHKNYCRLRTSTTYLQKSKYIGLFELLNKTLQLTDQCPLGEKKRL